MRRRIKQVGVVVLAGSFLTLLMLQAHLSEESWERREELLQRAVLHYDEPQSVIANFEEYGTSAENVSNSYEYLSIPENESNKNKNDQDYSLAEDAEVINQEKTPSGPQEYYDEKDEGTVSVSSTSSSHFPIPTSSPTKPADPISSDGYCPDFPSDLVGALNVNTSYEPTETEAMAAAGAIKHGCYTPTKCRSRQVVAIIIPYKNRLRHLITLTHHLHPILQIEYCIIVAEQYDNGAFNKARVMNAAFKEITTKFKTKFDCVVFHDVDMMLEDDRNIYRCTNMPRHLSPAIDKFNYTLAYGTQYGGVTAMSVENYKKVNGHSNNFWGWGGEDNDMENRIHQNNLFINVSNPKYGRYKMIPHDHPWWFSPLFGVGSYLKNKGHWSEKKVDQSGLSDILYGLRFRTHHKLWTKITLDIRTFLVEKAIVHFKGYDDVGQIEQRSSSYNTEPDEMEDGKPSQPKCVYYTFTDKTVNKTLGIMEANRLKYGRMYDSLDKAKSICDEMQEFCAAIVEEHPGKFSLRSTGYMHENILKYRVGLVHQQDITEVHHTRSVRVKACPGLSEYTSFFRKPIVLSGDSKKGPHPEYSIKFHIRLFYEMNKTLYFTNEILSAHGRTELDLVNLGLKEKGSWSHLTFPYNTKMKLLNTSDPRSLLAAVGKRTTMKDILRNMDGILTIKTPLNGLLRRPGCYVSKSSLIDELGNALMTWNWWFEVRAKTKEIEDEILDGLLLKSKRGGHAVSVSMEEKRKLWLQHQELMKRAGKAGAIPEHILEKMKKASLDHPS